MLRKGEITKEQLCDAEALSRLKGLSVVDALLQLGYTAAEAVGRAMAEAAQVPYFDMQNIQIDMSIIELVPESVARENCVIPVAETKDTLTVLIADPTDLETLEKLRFILNRNIVPLVSAADAIMEAINLHYGQVIGESADSMLQEFTDTAIDFTESYDDSIHYLSDMHEQIAFSPSSVDESDICYAEAPIFFEPPFTPPITQGTNAQISEDEASFPSPPIVRLVRLVIEDAVQVRASHIILISKEDRFTVAYIIDDEQVDRDSPPFRLLFQFVNQFRVLAKLDIFDRQSFQSGTVHITIGDRDLDLTVYCIDNELMVALSSADLLSEAPAKVREWLDQHQPLKSF